MLSSISAMDHKLEVRRSRHGNIDDLLAQMSANVEADTESIHKMNQEQAGTNNRTASLLQRKTTWRRLIFTCSPGTGCM